MPEESTDPLNRIGVHLKHGYQRVKQAAAKQKLSNYLNTTHPPHDQQPYTPSHEYTKRITTLRHHLRIKAGRLIEQLLPYHDTADFDRVQAFENLLDAFELGAKITIVYPAAPAEGATDESLPPLPPAQPALSAGPAPAELPAKSEPEAIDMPENESGPTAGTEAAAEARPEPKSTTDHGSEPEADEKSAEEDKGHLFDIFKREENKTTSDDIDELGDRIGHVGTRIWAWMRGVHRGN